VAVRQATGDRPRDMDTAALPGDRLPLEGARNFRDLGGYQTVSGRSVRRRHLYRSDRLSGLTDADLEQVAALGIHTVIDLRYEAEVRDHPNRLWPTVRRHEHVPMAGELSKERSFLDRVLDGEVTAITDDDVAQSYLDMLQAHPAEFARIVRLVLDGHPTLFHCTAGKDRTGLTAMLLLGVLGVDEELILDDFARSNEHRAERRIAELRDDFAARGLDVEAFRPALSAPRPAMVHAMAWLEREAGGPEGYLLQVCGVGPDEVDALRRLLLV
jgi:protein-tyrosine phosphatase